MPYWHKVGMVPQNTRIFCPISNLVNVVSSIGSDVWALGFIDCTCILAFWSLAYFTQVNKSEHWVFGMPRLGYDGIYPKTFNPNHLFTKTDMNVGQYPN